MWLLNPNAELFVLAFSLLFYSVRRPKWRPPRQSDALKDMQDKGQELEEDDVEVCSLLVLKLWNRS